ncbi:MAG: sulfite exporter TauE/SafE family protein [Candidatus Bathyarchaeota archaeon]|nr:sulfite exporter TauE/SafE family protein [Candidatus Bathyarchaeota archaeon]MDH4292346.1 sulfite exporter TauE/SafE family protein [Dehalococcoidia bacterium]MDH5419277.1 sulfite exporter TauE/SafE family protein [Candidatus Bathyarchaeota archaeon]MDH5702247.1 sulfite exporter TauE/SafE family protein [Candidatus Bathyarchaeota archaeon]
MNIVEALLVLILGFMVGVPSSMVGLGGGFIVVPVLILFFQLPANNAIAISLVAICGTTFSSTLGYIRQRRVDYKLGLFYDILDVPGIVLGAYITTLLPQNVLAGICGVFIIFISVLLIRNKGKSFSGKNPKANDANMEWTRNRIDSEGHAFMYTLRSPPLALASSFLGGLITGLSGLGGGITDVSTMILLGVPAQIAVATSEFAMAVTNGAGVVAHGLLNNVLIEYALPITIGTIIGAQVGCSLAKRVKGKAIRKILSLIAILAGLRLIYSFFTP